MKKRTGILSVLALILAAGLLCTACGNAIEASLMELVKTEGAVDVSDKKGKAVAIAENMKLYSGYQMITESQSYAWINLDSVKLTKMDENSEIEIQSDGKHLEVLVKQGGLYFNITQPLGEDETLDIRTSTMAVGIRGTCGWIVVPDENHMLVYILEGTVECSVTDPDSGETASSFVSGFEMAELSFDPDSKEGSRCGIRTGGFYGDEIPEFVLQELMQNNEEWLREIYEYFGMVFPGSEGTAETVESEQPSEPEEDTGSTAPTQSSGDELTDKMRFLAGGDYDSLEITEWYSEQGTYLMCLAADGKGAGTPYALMDTEGNTLLEGFDDGIWRTANGYARIIYCEPGTTEGVGNSYDVYQMVMGLTPGDVYVELYDWSGNYVESQKLNCEPGDAWMEGPKVYAPSKGEYINYGFLYSGDYNASDDIVDCELVEDGFIVRSKAGEELGHVVIKNAENLRPVVIGNFLGFWERYYFVRYYWVETD